MNLMKKALAALTLAGAIAAPAVSSAAPIIDVVNPPDVLITTYKSFSYTHNIVDNGYVPGMPIASASLEIVLKDNLDLLGENVRFFFDGIYGGSVHDVPWTFRFGPSTYTFSVAASLVSDGLLNVSLNLGCHLDVFGFCLLPQDVIFDRSTLTVDVARVPEPATLGMLGIGLLGLAGMRRRREV